MPIGGQFWKPFDKLSGGLQDPTLFSEFRMAIEASLQTFGLIDDQSAIHGELAALFNDLSSIDSATR